MIKNGVAEELRGTNVYRRWGIYEKYGTGISYMYAYVCVYVGCLKVYTHTLNNYKDSAY